MALPGALDVLRIAVAQHPHTDVITQGQAVLDAVQDAVRVEEDRQAKAKADADAAEAVRIDTERRAQAKAEADAVEVLRIEKERQAEAETLAEKALAEPVAAWSNATVRLWLQRIDLAEYVDKFASFLTVFKSVKRL